MSDLFSELCDNNNLNEIQIKIVAFDLFDTLIARNVSPMHVHRMWAEELIKKYSLHISADRLVNMKLDSFRICKLGSIIHRKDRECHYRDMVNILLKRLGIPVDAQIFYRDCLDCEISVEKQVSYPLVNRIDLLESAHKAKKKTIIITDMYLPSQVILAVLAYHNISVDKVYISSEILFQKSSGRLYRFVAADMGAFPGQILMLGDNETSDYEKAVAQGFQALYIENKDQHIKYENFEKRLEHYRYEFKAYMNKKQYKAPFSDVVFPMYLFVSRLYEELVQDGCENVLFMSREGELFKKLFDTYQTEIIPEEKRVQTHYLYASRRATIVPSLHRIDKESFKEIYKNYPAMSILTFLRNLGLEHETELLLEAGSQYDIEQEIVDFENSYEYEWLLRNELFRNKCLEKAEEQRKFFIQYLDDMDIDYLNKGLYLVDVGYAGTSQNNIYAVFDERVKINGYYMFLYRNKEAAFNRKKGILYDINRDGDKDAFTYNSGVIEMLCLASHCGVEGYKKEGDSIVPVFHFNKQELLCYKEIIQDIQNNILKEFIMVTNLISNAYLDEIQFYKKFLKRYKQFIFKPTIEEMNLFLKIPFVDNFAVYREYIPEKTHKKHQFFSIKGFMEIMKSKGRCIRKQNTQWGAASLYKLDMRCMNNMLYIFSRFVLKAVDPDRKAGMKNGGNR